MQLRQKTIIEWLTSEPLTNGETRVVEIGNMLSTHIVLEDRGIGFVTFGIVSSHALTLEIQGCFEPAFAAVDVMITLPVLAGVYMTPYDLAAPHNQTGYVTVTRPLIRVQIADTAAANHAYTRLYVKAWG